jgi:hypothetical protein
MSGAVDNQLLRDETKDFYDHIEICGSCRDDYELEKLTKAYLKKKITFVDVPYDVEKAIMAQFSSHVPQKRRRGFISRLFSNSMFQPILAVGIVLIIGIVLFFANKPNIILPILQEPASVVSTRQDALSLAETNFQDVLSGKFKPEITAAAISDVASYLNQNAGYAMRLPSVASADWIGGLVSSYDGNKMAQVVYKMGEDYIYICSFPRNVVDSPPKADAPSVREKIFLPLKCTKAIENKGWFWSENSNGDTQAAWSSDDHVCIATSNLEKNDLVVYLRPPTESDSETAKP